MHYDMERGKEMYLQELLILTQCLLGILMLIFLHKINQLKKQVDTIVKDVTQYLSFLENDVERDVLQEENNSKMSKEEVENHIIQAVLKEYFP